MANPKIIPFYFQEAWRHKKLVIPTLILVPTTVILDQYIAPLFIAWLLLHIQTDTITLANSWTIIALYAVTELYTQVFAERITLRFTWRLQIEGAAHLYRLAYDKLADHSVDFYANTFTGSLVSKVNRFAGAFINFWDVFNYQVLYIATAMVATIVGLSFLIWQYALVLLVLSIIFVICAYFGTRFMRTRYKERSEAYNEISGKLADSIGNILAVKADAKETSERTVLDTAIDTMVLKERRARNGFLAVSTVYTSIQTIIKISALVASVLAMQAGLGSAAVLYICLTYTFNLIIQLSNVNGLLRSYYQITGDSADLLDIVQMPPAVVDTSSKKLKVTKSKIIFNDVSFTHPVAESEEPQQQSETLFEHFSLTIPSRQKVGLVGVSGSGKSTLLKLLMRFYDVDDGTITIDGQNIAKVTQASLHETIAYVPQEPLLFHRSIQENIAYARPDATFEEVYAAAKSANALEFIEKLPNKFETLVGERGVKLSGGQRQRVAIARAILKGAPLLILDEATSALDSESEAFIQDALASLMEHRTSIVIAHRLSTIANLDRIVLLQNGTILEDGTHDELLKLGGMYAKLWARQSGGFIESDTL